MAPRGGSTTLPSPRQPPATVANASVKRYTWKQVAEHNTGESAWVIVEGKVYDVTAFLDKHPGGREMMLLAAGRECTDLFNMYHALNVEKARKYLGPYEIGVLEGPTEFPVFAPDSRGFYRTLSSRVNDYFKRTGYDPKGPLPGLLRMVPVFAAAAACYCIMNNLLWPTAHFGIKLLAAAAFGVLQALPLLHVMHDASHAAIGHNETWWKVIGRGALDWYAGACMMSWHHQHIVGHHVYTNVYLADPDLPYSEGDPRRLVQRQRWAWLFKYQHLYLPVLYGVLGIRSRIADVLDTWLARTSGKVRVNFYDNAWHRIWLTKGVWATWRIIVPLLVLGVPAAQYWSLFLIAELGTGYWLAWNFEVSHISEDVAFPNGDKESATLEDAWAVAQVKTSVDYGHNDPITTFLTGALNYQIEHHLFPGVSQYHYPALAPIVMETCKEFGVPYRLEPNFRSAWSAHLSYLKRLGQEGKAHHVD